MTRQLKDLVVVGVRLCHCVQILFETRKHLNDQIAVRCEALEACGVELHGHLLEEVLVEDQLALRPVECIAALQEVFDGDVCGSSCKVCPAFYQVNNVDAGVADCVLGLDLQSDEVVTVCAVKVFHVHNERVVYYQEDLVDERCKLCRRMESAVPLNIGDRYGKLPGNGLTIYALVNGRQVERINACGRCTGNEIRPRVGRLHIRCLDRDEGSDRCERFAVLEERVVILRTVALIGIPVTDHYVEKGLCELLNGTDDVRVVASVDDLFK